MKHTTSFNGEGPWGSSKGSSSKPGSGQGPQDNVYDFFKKPPSWQNKSPKQLALLIGGVLVGLWLLSGFYQVNPDEQGLVLRFGKWVKTTEPGWHYHLPTPIEEVLTPQVTLTNQINIGFGKSDESQMLTGDRNIVDVSVIVQWHIKNASEFLFNIRNPQKTIQAVTESVIREIIGRMPIDRTFAEGRAEIQQKAKDHVQEILDQYHVGVQITEINLADVNPPQSVIESFREVDRAYADQERMLNEAEGYRSDIVPKARGTASQITQKAEAYKEAVTSKAIGESSHFQALLKEYDKNPEIMKKRLYFETMEKVYKGANKVIMSGKTAGQVLPHMKLPSMTESVKKED